MPFEISLATILIVAFAGSIASFFILPRFGKLSGPVAALLPAGLFAAFIAYLPSLATDEQIVTHTQQVNWVPSIDVNLALRLDGFSMLFALLITGIAALVVLYAAAYYPDEKANERARFIAFILLFMSAMLGAVLSDNVIALFIFWEMTSLISFMLIGFKSTSAAARKAALQSLIITAGGGLALFGGLLIAGMEAGTFSLSAMTADPEGLAASPWFAIMVALILLGAFTKSAQFPFHFWLPNAMQAPTPASAYLHSATMVKLGIYLLARFDPVLSQSTTVLNIMLGFGLVTMLVAAYNAIRTDGLKSMLAYSTVASLGILVTLIALEGPGASIGVAGFILAHALYKAALFFSAGIVIHATGKPKVADVHGLLYVFPITAAATVLASLSMAGLPPFIGFIAKEYVIEAKLEASFVFLVTAATVVVNAVLVAVAGVLALKPFFTGPMLKKSDCIHGETFGMSAGPAVLAILGIALGVFADIPQFLIVGPAAIALNGEPFYVSFELWAGITPMLLLSILVVAVGGVFIWQWGRLRRLVAHLAPIEKLSAERGYYFLFDGLLALSKGTTRTVQNGSMRSYVVTTIGVVAVALIYGIVVGFAGTNGFGDVSALVTQPIRPYLLIVCLLVAASAVVASISRSLVVAVVAVGLLGYGIALVFLMNGAPDLALTQFSVETLFVVIVMAVLVKLPTIAIRRGDHGRFDFRPGDALLSIAFALTVFVVVLSIATKPFDLTVTQYFAERSLSDAFGRNVVNVILVDFRALDTLGEIAVVAFAAISVWGLLSIRKTALPETSGDSTVTMPSLIFVTTARFFFVIMIAVSIFVLFRGHNEPGGGFIGGLIASAGFAVLALALGVNFAQKRLWLHPIVVMGIGLVLAIVSGLPGAWLNGSFLTHQWGDLNLGFTSIKIGTTMIFDLGVFLTVLGGVLAFMVRVQQQNALVIHREKATAETGPTLQGVQQ
ncbi:MAG: hydrogen gas-evolving membrane-bound hydrogenase subunit E [Pseudomonadota bacterium]